MSSKTKKQHDPLFHISRRDNIPLRKSILFRALSVIFAFIICALILSIYNGYSPIDFIATLFTGTIGDSFNIFVFLGRVAILLGLGLALVPAFKMKFWNIGADGQALMGALGCYLTLYISSRHGIPGGLALVISLVVAIILGALWGLIPAIFKAIWNTNETLFTLMMNYIAIQIVLFTKNYIVFTIQKGKNTTIPIPEAGTLASPFGIEQLLTIIIVTILAVIVAIYVKKTKQGYELSLVGDSENSAKYAGVNVKKVIIRTICISGAICGLVGWLLVTGGHQPVATDITANNGFTAIIVCWLAKFNPAYMILTAGLVAFLQIGMKDVTAAAGIRSDGITNIFIGVFFFFIIAFEFFITYKINLRKNDEGKIDNKFFKWNYEKIYTPVGKFCNKICDSICNFFKKLFKKDKNLVLATDGTPIIESVEEPSEKTEVEENIEKEEQEDDKLID